MAATTGTALPAFSYAQAAKGLAPAPTTTQSQVEVSNSSPDPPKPDMKSPTPQTEKSDPLLTTGNAPGPSKDCQKPSEVTTKTPGLDTDPTPTDTSGSEQNHTSVNKLPLPSHLDAVQSSESTSPVLANSETTLPRDDELAANSTGPLETWDKQSETSTMVDRSAQPTDTPKEKPGDEDWINVQAPQAEKELKAAPAPTVNIWEQRREALDAKAKASAALRSSTTTIAPTRSKAQPQPARNLENPAADEESKGRNSGKPVDKVDGNLRKKQADETRQRDDGKRVPRQVRPGEIKKDATTPSVAPPSVGDAASWPTPETANHEERKKPQAQDKIDKNDAKSPGMKPGQKWVPVPYVPSAKFNTPLPPTISRRGGRPLRGARDGANRGGHLPQGIAHDKPEKMKAAALPPISTQTLEQERGRDQDSSGGHRATSAPTQTHRAASADPALADKRKTMPSATSDRGPTFDGKKSARSELQDVTSGNSTVAHEGTTSHQSRRISGSFPRQHPSSARAATFDARQVAGDSHAHPRTHAATERRGTNDGYDRPLDTPARYKDNFKNRDLDSRSESWRDREVIGDRAEQRNSRGRGGYRGRGAHSTYANPQTHAFTAPLPQQPFSAGKSHGHNARHRPSSAAYGGMTPQSHQRSASRSQSIPSQSIYPAMPNGFTSPVSPTQTDMSPIYSGYPTIYPGIMSAVPFTPALEPMALMSMVSAQLEYYFSIENLCKDVYLRSNMNSHGWVPLRVIAGFNRIKSLTEDMNLIRHVCQLSRNIEFQPGEDGMDRVRKLDKWEQWILDVDQRQPHAQIDAAPSLASNQSPPHVNSTYSSAPQGTSPAWASAPFYPGYAEAPSLGTSGRATENHNATSPASGALPDIPSGENFSLTNGRSEHDSGQGADAPDRPSPVTQSQNTVPNGLGPVNTGMTAVNGDRPVSPQEIGIENAFSNERMNELHVCVRHPTQQFQPPFMSAATRTFSHGSIDGAMPGNERVLTPMPSLRGGSGTPDSSDPGRDRPSFIEKTGDNSSRGVFWMKDGAPPGSWDHQGSTVEKYQSLHDRALAERIPGIVTDDMDWLYQFWSHFLVRNFNYDMYHDFRSLAWDDAGADYSGGLHRLGQYYGALLTGQRILTETLAEDIVKLAESEMEDRRQMFRNLRSAWRNGAFNLKSRKVIGKYLSPELKDSLEK